MEQRAVQEIISNLLKSLLPYLKKKVFFYTILILTVVFWMGLLQPGFFAFFQLDTWRNANDLLFGLGTLISTLALTITILIIGHDWLEHRLAVWKAKRKRDNTFHNLSLEQRRYLFQFVNKKTTLVVFSPSDPVVASLRKLNLIYQTRTRTSMASIRFNVDFLEGEPFEIDSDTYEYLKVHPELFIDL